MKSLRAVLWGLFILLGTIPANADDAPVSASHTLVGYSREGASVTVDYTLHVVNTGETAFSNITLALVPVPPLKAGTVKLNIGGLAPHESADLPVQVTTGGRFGKEAAARIPLYWAGTGVDPKGTLLEFPVKSRPGGVK